MDIILLRRSIRNSAGITFSRSGGPGGQNVNKLNTKVTLRLRLMDLEGLSEAEYRRLGETLGSRLSQGKSKVYPINQQTDGTGGTPGNSLETEVPGAPLSGEELVLSSSEERSQRINLERAYAKAEALIVLSAKLPKKRKPTKISAAAREKRLRIKRLQSEKKSDRKPFSV